MLVGRIILGMGGESMTAAQCAIITKWFRHKDLALALGFNTSVIGLGLAVNA